MNGSFTPSANGTMRIYDAGTDKGPSKESGVSIFTPPEDTSLDVPENPALNIHPLAESAEDPGFDGRDVGRWTLKLVN